MNQKEIDLIKEYMKATSDLICAMNSAFSDFKDICSSNTEDFFSENYPEVAESLDSKSLEVGKLTKKINKLLK
jgi:hypothetical protein